MLLVGSDTVGVLSVNASAGSSREVVKLAHPAESDFHEIAALPDGKGVLFTVHVPSGADRIDVFSNGARKTVLEIRGESLRSPMYAAPGYLVYARQTTSPGIWAVRFSLDRLQTEGEPLLMVPNGAYPSVAADGTLALVRVSDVPSQVVSVDRRGSVQALGQLQGRAFDAGQWTGWALSPDGRRLAVSVLEPSGSDLWSYDLGRTTMTRLTVGEVVALNPTWSRDGTRIFFAGFDRRRVWNVFAVPSGEPSKPRTVLQPAEEMQWPCAISPDGKLLVYGQATGGVIDLWVAPLDGTAARPLMKTPFNETEAAFSPDGQSFAYTSDESGRPEVYVRAFPIDARRSQASSGGGSRRQWSPDGRELYYRTARGIAVVRITSTQSTIEPGDPSELLLPPGDSTLSSSYAAATDGQRFLFLRSAGADRVSVILNWASQLRR
jgi:dipeptidyl aminopeptidase/acylaminoacyl peptidase